MKKQLRINTFVLFVLSICLLVLIKPLFQEKLIIGDDYLFHLARISSLADTLQAGIFPVKIHLGVLHNYGYGYSFFYANLLLYFPALLLLIGLNLTLAYKIFLVGLFFAQTISVYYAARTITKNKLTALVPTVMILISHNYILNVYYRFALGEMLAFIFLPFVVAGLYNLVYDHFRKPWILVGGFTGVILTHVITSVIALVISIVFAVFHLKRIISEKNLIRIVLAALLVLGFTAYYWMPLMEQMEYQKLLLAYPNLLSSKECISFLSLFSNVDYTIGSGVLIPVLLMMFGWLFYHPSRRSRELWGYGVLTALMTTELFQPFWSITENYFNLQFPWRLFGLSTIFLSFSVGLWLTEWTGKLKLPAENQVRKIAIGLVIMIDCFFGIRYINRIHNYAEGLDKASIYANLYSLGYTYEYLPATAMNLDFINYYDVVISSKGNQLTGIRTGLAYTFETDGSSDYDVPLILYKGYIAYNENNQSTAGLTISDAGSGLIRITVTDEQIKTITVRYVNTGWQNLSYMISGCSLLIVAVYLAVHSRKKHLNHPAKKEI